MISSFTKVGAILVRQIHLLCRLYVARPLLLAGMLKGALDLERDIALGHRGCSISTRTVPVGFLSTNREDQFIHS